MSHIVIYSNQWCFCSSKHFWGSLYLAHEWVWKGEWASSSLWKESLPRVFHCTEHGLGVGVRSLSPRYQLLASERTTWLLGGIRWSGERKYKMGRIGYRRQCEQRIKGSGRHQQAWEQVTLSDTHRVSLSSADSRLAERGRKHLVKGEPRFLWDLWTHQLCDLCFQKVWCQSFVQMDKSPAKI